MVEGTFESGWAQTGANPAQNQVGVIAICDSDLCCSFIPMNVFQHLQKQAIQTSKVHTLFLLPPPCPLIQLLYLKPDSFDLPSVHQKE